MPEQALYLKWRPLTFEDVVGQEHITRTLRNSLKTGRIRHAYLFSGPRGTGKTTSARLLAKAVNCLVEDAGQRPCNACAHCVAMNEGRFLDLIEIDAASHTGVDDVRDLRDRIAFTPAEGRYKVYIIDEVHRFSGNAFDALLKTLEEPPDHALFILATTEIDKVPATIKSRCLPFEFRRLSIEEVVARLAEIAETEGLQIERGALELIAREGTGSARDSISLLDQIVADPQEVITLELTQRILGTASARSVRDVVDALVEQDVARGLHIINTAIDSGSDPRQFAQQVVSHLRAVLLAQTASADLVPASSDDRALYDRQAAQASRGLILRAIRHFNDAANESGAGWQPQLPLELALIESLQQPVEHVAIPATLPDGNGPAAPARTTTVDVIPPPEMTGVPPIVSVALVQQKWPLAQRLIHEHSANASDLIANLPNLMNHAVVRAVEGDMVVLSVSQRLYYDKLIDGTRLRWVERAISRVTNVPLRVKYMLADSEDSPLTPSPDQIGDPLIEAGLELGAQIIEEDE